MVVKGYNSSNDSINRNSFRWLRVMGLLGGDGSGVPVAAPAKVVTLQ